jgi:hypothetical protein
MRRRILALLSLPAGLLLGGCVFGGNLRPLMGLNMQLARVGSSHDPALRGDWLALIAGRQGREQVQLINVATGMPVPLPGLNRPDAQPLSVSLDQRGERMALVRVLDGRTELVLYRRSLMALQLIPIEPAGVPRRVELSADGRLLAVEISRGGNWQVDLLELP